MSNRPGTKESRLFGKFAKRFDFVLHPQWTDNFVCEV